MFTGICGQKIRKTTDRQTLGQIEKIPGAEKWLERATEKTASKTTEQRQQQKETSRMKTTSRKEKLQMIREAYDALADVCTNGFTDEAEALLRLCRHEETEHRAPMGGSSFRESHTSDTIGIADAAKLFVVHDLASFLTGAKPMPELKDYLHVKKSHYHAGAMVLEFGEKIKAAWSRFDLGALAALDYCEFVRVKREQPATA